MGNPFLLVPISQKVRSRWDAEPHFSNEYGKFGEAPVEKTSSEYIIYILVVLIKNFKKMFHCYTFRYILSFFWQFLTDLNYRDYLLNSIYVILSYDLDLNLCLRIIWNCTFSNCPKKVQLWQHWFELILIHAFEICRCLYLSFKIFLWKVFESIF